MILQTAGPLPAPRRRKRNAGELPSRVRSNRLTSRTGTPRRSIIDDTGTRSPAWRAISSASASPRVIETVFFALGNYAIHRVRSASDTEALGRKPPNEVPTLVSSCRSLAGHRTPLDRGRCREKLCEMSLPCRWDRRAGIAKRDGTILVDIARAHQCGGHPRPRAGNQPATNPTDSSSCLSAGHGGP